MSQAYNDKLERMLGNDIVEKEKGTSLHDDRLVTRYITFICKDGSVMSLNYPYVVKCESNPERTKIVVTFTTEEVTLEGQFLESLHLGIICNTVKVIQCMDGRYNALSEANTVVNDIKIRNLAK
ncbi:MAG: hypothetical protein JSS82_08185 [Bacteroidetes bacterium]|nr:hypothetical protein [Bacteroidota bacterium]